MLDLTGTPEGIPGFVLRLNICECFAIGFVIEMYNGEDKMAPLSNPGERFWRTDYRTGRNIYALLSNDVTKTSQQDPLIGTMDNTELAEIVVDTHNLALKKYGRHFRRVLGADD